MNGILEIDGQRYFRSSLVETTKDDEEKVERGKWYRADGGLICSCGLQYKRHKMLDKHPWLTKLCNGELVHL